MLQLTAPSLALVGLHVFGGSRGRHGFHGLRIAILGIVVVAIVAVVLVVLQRRKAQREKEMVGADRWPPTPPADRWPPTPPAVPTHRHPPDQQPPTKPGAGADKT